jgi:hypothetical protein
LRSFVAPAEQQNNSRSFQSIIEPITWAYVDSQFPDTIPAKFVIAEVPQLKTEDPTINCFSCLRIAKSRHPFRDWLPMVRSDITANFAHAFDIRL